MNNIMTFSKDQKFKIHEINKIRRNKMSKLKEKNAEQPNHSYRKTNYIKIAAITEALKNSLTG